MKWIKYTLKTTTEASDLVIDMMTTAGVDGVLIEDNVPISEADKKRMFIDFLPVLPIDEGVCYLSFFLEDDSEEESLLAEIQNGLAELKDFVDVGEGTIVKSETEDKDWINNWKEFFKSFTVDEIVIKPTWEEIQDVDAMKIPVGYEKIKLDLYGVEISACVSEKNKDDDVILIYAKNTENGYEGYYSYDKVEKTIQRYFGDTLAIAGDKTNEMFEKQEYEDNIKKLGIIVATTIVMFVISLIIIMKLYSDLKNIKNDNYLV